MSFGSLQESKKKSNFACKAICKQKTAAGKKLPRDNKNAVLGKFKAFVSVLSAERQLQFCISAKISARTENSLQGIQQKPNFACNAFCRQIRTADE